MKIRPVGAELFNADRRTNGRTDMTMLTVAFRNFPKAPKNTSPLFCEMQKTYKISILQQKKEDGPVNM
jgi:hypothetical protein